MVMTISEQTPPFNKDQLNLIIEELIGMVSLIGMLTTS